MNRIKGMEHRDGRPFKRVDDTYMIWYNALIGMMAMTLIGFGMGAMWGFIVWGLK